MRATLRYEALRANPALTALERTTRVNGDLLATYQINPWTALHVGYNGNGQNLALESGPNGTTAERRARGLLDD